MSARSAKHGSAADRMLHFEQLEQRCLLTGVELPPVNDALTGLDADPSVDQPALVRIRLELQDAEGTPVQPLLDDQGHAMFDPQDGHPLYFAPVGSELRVQVYVQDLSEQTPGEQGGVFSAGMDIAFNDPTLFLIGGVTPDEVELYRQFFTADAPYSLPGLRSNGRFGNNAMNEFGELLLFSNSLTPLGFAEQPLMHFTITAGQVGVLSLGANPAEWMPISETLVYGSNFLVDTSRIDYGATIHLVIGQSADALNDADIAEMVSNAPVIDTTGIDVPEDIGVPGAAGEPAGAPAGNLDDSSDAMGGSVGRQDGGVSIEIQRDVAVPKDAQPWFRLDKLVADGFSDVYRGATEPRAEQITVAMWMPQSYEFVEYDRAPLPRSTRSFDVRPAAQAASRVLAVEVGWPDEQSHAMGIGELFDTPMRAEEPSESQRLDAVEFLFALDSDPWDPEWAWGVQPN